MVVVGQGEIVDCFWIVKEKGEIVQKCFFSRGREKKVVTKERSRCLGMRRAQGEQPF